MEFSSIKLEKQYWSRLRGLNWSLKMGVISPQVEVLTPGVKILSIHSFQMKDTFKFLFFFFFWGLIALNFVLNNSTFCTSNMSTNSITHQLGNCFEELVQCRHFEKIKFSVLYDSLVQYALLLYFPFSCFYFSCDMKQQKLKDQN